MISSNPAQAIRTLIAENTRMGAQLLSDVLRRDCRIDVIGTTAGYSEAHGAAATQGPDVAVISAELDGDRQKGLELCRELSRSSPTTRVVVLLESPVSGEVIAAFRAGARGILFRADSAKPLAKCIHRVYDGQIWASSLDIGFLVEAFAESKLQWANFSAMSQLSQREHQVVRCVVDGLTNRDISERLKLSEHTVKNYMFHIFEKLGLSNRVELIIYTWSHVGASNRNGHNGFSNDDAALANWYREAVERGCGVMQYRLGEMYRDGLGVPQDNVSAYVWFSLAEKECCTVRNLTRVAARNVAVGMAKEQLREAEQRVSDLVAKHRHLGLLVASRGRMALRKTPPARIEDSASRPG